MHGLADLLPGLAAIIASAFFVLWVLVRPFSFRYRIDSGDLVVLTFFVLPAARIPLTMIRMPVPQDGSRRARRRVLVPFHLRILQKTCIAVADRELLVLPHWHRGWIGSADPERDFELARTRRRELPLSLAAPVAGQLSGDTRFQIPGVLVAWAVHASRLWAKASARVVHPAADCLIILPLWLAYLDWTGAGILASQYPWSRTYVLKSMGPVHFGSLLFVFLCGVSIRVLLAIPLRIPRLAGLLTFVAVFSLFLVQHSWGHELSHALFDSCEGYDDLFHGSAILMLLGAFTIFRTACQQRTFTGQALDTGCGVEEAIP